MWTLYFAARSLRVSPEAKSSLIFSASSGVIFGVLYNGTGLQGAHAGHGAPGAKTVLIIYHSVTSTIQQTKSTLRSLQQSDPKVR
jgi:hypothetical protein